MVKLFFVVLKKLKAKLKDKKVLIRLALVLILLLDVYFILAPLLLTDLLPGADSPFYLYYAGELAKTGQPGGFAFRDRTLAVLEPAIISQILGVSPLWGIRIFLTAVSILMLLGLFVVSRYIGGETLAILTVLIALLSGTFARFFWDLYANVFAISTISLIIFLLGDFKLKPKEFFLAATLIGSLFLIHNLTSFGFSITVFPLFLLAIFWSYFRLRKWREVFFYGGAFWLIVFLCGSGFLIHFLPLFIASVIDPVGNLDKLAFRGLVNTGIYIPYQPVQFGSGPGGISMVTHAILALITKKLFVPAMLGVMVAFYLLRKKKRKRLIPLFIWIGGLSILVLQGLFGFNWAPERFALAAFQPLAIFAALFIASLSLLPKIKEIFGSNKRLWQVGFATIIFAFFITNLPRLRASAALGLPIATNPIERKMAEDVNQKLTKRDVILVNGIRFYWTRYFLSNTNVVWGEYYIICGNEDFVPYYDPNNVRTAEIFSGTLKPEEIKEKILEIRRSEQFERVFLLAFGGDKCGNGEQFDDLKFLKKLNEDGGYKVYEFIEKNNEKI